MSGLLSGRHALITGAANGIGLAVADRFRAEGARVSGVDVEPGTDFRADLRETERIPHLVNEIEEAAGPVEILVSVAGIYEPARATEMHLASYRRVLAVNLDAPVVLAQRCGRAMAARGWGRILSVTSIHARFSEARGLSYDVSKAGLEAATRTLAIELAGDGVLVNALAPGFVRTRMSIVEGRDELDSEWFRSIYVEAGKLPLGRPAEAPEVAAHAAWLCSAENTYVTGQTLTVDGGLTVTF